MRIAHLAPLVTAIREPPLHGAATFVVDLATGLQEAGHEIDLVAAAGSQVPGLRIVDTGINPDDLASTLLRPLTPPVPERARDAAWAFEAAYDLIAAGDYDLVHNHAFDVPAIEGARRLSCPVVHTLHAPPDPTVAAALREAATSTNPPLVAAVAEHQRAAWARLVPIDATLRPGVPVQRIPWSGASGDYLLFAGRLSPEKGTLEAIEIARRAGYDLVVGGPSYDSAYAEEVKRAISATPRATFAGPLTRPELWELMTNSSALIFPIKWEEPFGLVVAEAQAAGCPVVGYRRGALTENIVDGVTGAAVNPGDLGAAVRALDHLERFERAACRRHAEATLDVPPMIAAHLALYERAVAGSGRTAARGGLS